MSANAVLIIHPGSIDRPRGSAWAAAPWRRRLALWLGLRHPTITLQTARASDRDAHISSPEQTKRFEGTIGPHFDSAYNFARFLCGDADTAADIVQEAFLRAFRSFAGYRGGDPRAWIFAIIRNCHRAWRVEGRLRTFHEVPMAAGESEVDGPAYDIATDADTPETAVMRNSEAIRVRMVISGLSEPMREILVLRELEDLSYRQISEILEIPIGTVMSRLARARADFSLAWQTLQNREASQ